MKIQRRRPIESKLQSEPPTVVISEEAEMKALPRVVELREREAAGWLARVKNDYISSDLTPLNGASCKPSFETEAKGEKQAVEMAGKTGAGRLAADPWRGLQSPASPLFIPETRCSCGIRLNRFPNGKTLSLRVLLQGRKQRRNCQGKSAFPG
jgi:hypothetical protein